MTSTAPEYDDHEDFNNYCDESFGEFTMGQYSYLASEILFNVDLLAYKTESRAFVEAEDEPTGEDA